MEIRHNSPEQSLDLERRNRIIAEIAELAAAMSLESEQSNKK